MAIFNSYVSLPEGRNQQTPTATLLHPSAEIPRLGRHVEPLKHVRHAASPEASGVLSSGSMLFLGRVYEPSCGLFFFGHASRYAHPSILYTGLAQESKIH